MTSLMERYIRWWTARVDGSSLSLFRILFGTFLIADGIWLYFASLDISVPHGGLRIPYEALWFWPMTDIPTLQGICLVMSLLGFAVVIGFWARAAILLAPIAVFHFVVIDQTNYMNHFILIMITCLACACVPLDRYFSVRTTRSVFADRTVARFELFWVMGVFLCAYFLGGVAKLRPDWISGDLLALNFMGSQSRSPVARWFLMAGMVPFASWAVVVLELLAPLGLIWKRTRLVTVLSLIAFHVLNHHLFRIGLFSWMMLAAMVLYFEPDWPIRLLNRLVVANRSTDIESKPSDGTSRFGPLVLHVWVVVLVLVSLNDWRAPSQTINQPCQVSFEVRSPLGVALDGASVLNQRQSIKLSQSPSMRSWYARTQLCGVGLKVRAVASCPAGDFHLDGGKDLCRRRNWQ